MTDDDKTAFAHLLVTTANQYHRSFSLTSLDIYWHCLKDYTLVEIQTALSAHFKHTGLGRFMPQPSDILRQLRGDDQTQALLAWTKVKDAIRSVGSYQSLVFDDALIHAVIRDMDGWIALCQKTEKELTFAGHEFQKRYNGYGSRPPAQYPTHLIGCFEHQNQMHQQTIASPLLFGDQAAAIATYLAGRQPNQLNDRCTYPFPVADLTERITVAHPTQNDPPSQDEKASIPTHKPKENSHD